MKYLIIWFITYAYSVPCEQTIIHDEIYGDRVKPQLTLQACFETSTKRMEREFTNKDSADIFYQKVLNEIQTAKDTVQSILELKTKGRVDSVKCEIIK